MKYSHHYSKLDKEQYTTIRRYPKGKKGDIITETYPGGSHKAVIRRVYKASLKQLSDQFLENDTDCFPREQAYKLIQSFYQKPIDENEKLYIYILRRL